jgi:hypothetical protein
VEERALLAPDLGSTDMKKCPWSELDSCDFAACLAKQLDKSRIVRQASIFLRYDAAEFRFRVFKELQIIERLCNGR